MFRLLLLALLASTSALQAQVATTSALVNGLRARQIGPAVMSGRCTSIAVDANDAKTIYIGTASGGVWKSTTSGTVLRPIFDDHTMSIGKVAIAPTNSKTVYVGTGEPWVRNSVSVGTGMYKSTDAGSSWQAIGLEASERISDILVHPSDEKTVFVAALGHLWDANEQRGVFKSVDGGTTWKKVLYIDEHTGASGLSFDPSNPAVIYASMWGFRREPWGFDSGYGGKSGLFKSIDGGESWTEVEAKGLPEGKLGRIDIEFAPSNNKRLYASIECEDKEAKGLYRSDDGGASWIHISDDFGTTVRPFYFSNVIVSPHNDSVVAKCGLNAIISEDAGQTMRVMDRAIHSDIHDIWFDPANKDHLLVATDGGIYESYDEGQTAKMWMNLPVSQFYHVAVDRDEPYNIYGGLQDNGSWVGPSRKAGGIGNGDWKNTYGGDGFYAFRHPNKKDIIYSEYQGGNLVRYNNTTGQAKSIAPYRQEKEEKLRWNWNSPLLQSSHNADRIYFAAQYLYQSDDTGDSWQRISPDLTTDNDAKQQQAKSGGLSIDNSTAENHCTIYALAESPRDQNELWVGTDDGNVQVTRNGGKTWSNLRPAMASALPKVATEAGLWVTDIEVSPTEEGRAFVTLDGHRTGDIETYLLRTDDYGASWHRLNTQKVEGYALSVRQDLVANNLLFLGTEFGLYVSLDSGVSWERFENNLPRVAVRDMVIQPDKLSLVLATHGRGIAIIDDLSTWRQLEEDVKEEKIFFFETEPTVLRDPGAGGNWFGGSGSFVGSNPSSSAQIAYYANKRHTFGKMFIEVWKDGQKMRTLQAGKSAGLNIVNMPTARNKPKSAPSNNRMALVGSLFGPNLAAGTYDVKLIKGRDTFLTQFELAYDPTSPYGKTDREQQLEVATAMYDLSERLAYIYQTLEEVGAVAKETEIEGRKARRLLDSLSVATTRMKDRLTFTGGDFYVDEGEKIREEISNLYFKVVQYPGAPSAPQVEESKRLAVELDLIEQDHKELFADLLDPINEELTKAGKPVIAYSTLEAFLAGETKGGSLGGYQQWYRMEKDASYNVLTGTGLGTTWQLGLFR